ncbi:hypothetical protein BC628DRAFT_70208 [Trametes gibbosa]|nr:hypothetical protein BC628DRAFT_70208 [Trametes gibbosa]UVI59141.1 Zn(2)-Cys(6)42 [Trametes gibbosa]
MPREPACRNCAEKKVRCKISVGQTSCQRCASRNLVCEWPTASRPITAGTGSQKTSCERCRFKRIKCERSATVASLACIACSSRGESCSLSTACETTSADESQGSPETNRVHGDTPPMANTAPEAPGRTAWWTTVLAPSPQ